MLGVNPDDKRVPVPALPARPVAAVPAAPAAPAPVAASAPAPPPAPAEIPKGLGIEVAAATAQQEAAAAQAALAEAASAATPQEAAAAQERAKKEAEAAATDAAAATAGAAAQMAAAPADVKAELKSHESLKVISKSGFKPIPMPNNGWNFYSSILVAKEAIDTGREVDIPKEIKTLHKRSAEMAEQVSRAMTEEDKKLITVLITQEIPTPTNNELLLAKLKDIDASTEIDPALKDTVKQSLRFQYQPDSAVYKRDRSERAEPILTPDTYISLLQKPVDPSNLERGPMAWPDIQLIGPKIAEIVNASIYIYRTSKSDPTVYKLVSVFHREDSPHLFILYTTRNDFSVLGVKPGTDARAIGLVGQAMKGVKERSLRELANNIKGTGELVLTSDYDDAIKVAGERVQLIEDDGFNERADLLGAVSFRNRYFPGETDEEVINTAKHVFNMFFRKQAIKKTRAEISPAKDLLDSVVSLTSGKPQVGGAESAKEYIPPCSDDEREILLRGLRGRRITMYQQIQQQRSNPGDTVEIRRLLVRFQELEHLIKSLEYNEQRGNCQEYSKDGAPAGFSRMSTQQNDEIRSLLRQFSFLVLQAKNPINEYSARTNEATKLVGKLRKDPLTPQQMNTFLESWRKQAAKSNESIPSIIAEVLDTTDTQTGVLQTMVQDEIDKLYKDVVGMGRDEYKEVAAQTGGGLSAESMRNEFEALVTRLEQDEQIPRDRAYKLIRWFVDNTRKQWRELSDEAHKEDTLKASLTTKQEQIQGLSAKLLAAQESIKKIEDALAAEIDKNIDLTQKGANDAAAAKGDNDNLIVERDGLRTQIGQLQEELQASRLDLENNTKELDTVKGTLSSKGQEAVKATALTQQIQLKLDTLQKQFDEVSKERDSLKAERDRLAAQGVANAANIQDLQAKETAATEAAAAAAAKVKGLEAEIGTLKAGVDGGVAAGAEKDAKIRELDSLLAAAKAEEATTLAEKNDTFAKLTTARQEKGVLQKSVDDLNAQLALKATEVATAKQAAVAGAAAAAAQVADVTGKLNAAEATVNEKLKEIAANNDRLKHLTETITGLNTKLTEATRKAVAAAAAIEGGKASYAKLDAKSKAEAVKAKADLDKLTVEKGELQAELEKQKAFYDKEIAALKGIIENQKADIARLDGEVSTTTAKLVAAATDKEKITAQLSAVQRTADEEVKKFKETLDAKLTQLQDTVTDLNAQISNKGNKITELEEVLKTAKAQLEEQTKVAAQIPELQKQLDDGKIQLKNAMADLTAKQGAQGNFQAVVRELQTLATSVVAGKEYTLSPGIEAQAGDAFTAIFNSVKKLKATPVVSSTSQACFLSYFIVFFFKALFFTRSETQRRQEALKNINTATEDIMAKIKEVKLFPDGTDDKTIIAKIMEVIFSMLDASETLFINKETRTGKPASKDDIGLSVIKLKEDPATLKIFRHVFDVFRRKKLSSDMEFLEKSLVADLLIKQPRITFNKPMTFEVPPNPAPDLKDITTFPSMSFLPNGLDNVDKMGTSSDIITRFQVIDVPAGFKKKMVTVKSIIPPDRVADAQAEIKNALWVENLTYSGLFATFVVFGRKYMIAAKEDLLKNGCKIPAMIEDPQTIFASMEAEKSTVAAPAPPPPPPPAPVAPKPVTPAAVAEVLGTQSVVANAKKASNKVAMAIANAKKTANRIAAATPAVSQADINQKELIRRGWDKMDNRTAQSQLQGFYYDLYKQLTSGVKPEQRLLVLPLTTDKYMVEARSRSPSPVPSRSPSLSQMDINKKELIRRGWDKISLRDGITKFSGDYYRLFLILNGDTAPDPKLLALPLN